MLIENFVPDGLGNAVHADALAIAVGLGEDTRTLRKMVEDAHRRGVPVCSCGNGYFMPTNASEARIFLKMEQSRARKAQTAIAAVSAAMENLPDV